MEVGLFLFARKHNYYSYKYNAVLNKTSCVDFFIIKACVVNKHAKQSNN